MKKKIFLIIIIACIILIPILVYASKFIGIPIEQTISKEEVDKERKEEKENWIKNQENINSTFQSQEIDNVTLDKYAIKETEANQLGNKMDEIIKRFYPEEYNSILESIKENSDKMSLNELYMQPYSVRLFEIIIDIINNKNITENEKNILKDFLNQQYYFINNDSKVKNEIAEILNIE